MRNKPLKELHAEVNQGWESSILVFNRGDLQLWFTDGGDNNLK